jgi:hypothetical protein
MQEDSLETRVSVHEAVCAERYEVIKESFVRGETRMTRIELLLYAVIVVNLLGPGAAATMFKKIFGL